MTLDEDAKKKSQGQFVERKKMLETHKNDERPYFLPYKAEIVYKDGS